jgi:glycosyltransferase involved in cell wall biosynthesis
MRILLLEPYFTGSHRVWAEGYARHSGHQVSTLSLPGRWWKWRMHGGAVTLARLAEEWVSKNGPPDLLLATDMLDLTTLLALTRDWSADIPTALYMHENQLTYPLPDDPTTGPMRRQAGERDLHYAFINYTSMLAADRVLFNSQYHLDAWFSALPKLLKRFPDLNDLGNVSTLQERSAVLPLGLDLQRLQAGNKRSPYLRYPSASPIVLWNHRWEYDKDPATFFRALSILIEEGVDFRVAVCGESFRRVPSEFDHARERLGERVIQWGRIEPVEVYAQLLWTSDIVASTAIHDFFGAAVVEAIYCGCRPVLPRRLAYPEHIPQEQWAACLYDGFDQLVERLRGAILQPQLNLQPAVERYDWECMISQYDAAMAALA